jgi:hypothetical protein
MRPIVTYTVPTAQPTGPAGGSSQAGQPDCENKTKQKPQQECNAEAYESNDCDDLAENSASVDIRLVGVSDAGGPDFSHCVSPQVPGDGSEEAEEDADDPEDQDHRSLRVLRRSRSILLTVGQGRSVGLKIVRRSKSDFGTVLSVGMWYVGIAHSQPLLRSEPRTAASSQKACQGDVFSLSKVRIRDASDDGQHDEERRENADRYPDNAGDESRDGLGAAGVASGLRVDRVLHPTTDNDAADPY